MTSLAATRLDDDVDLRRSRGAPVGRGLLDRAALLEMLDRAMAKRVTVISAPPGSGKTSLLRSWAARPANAGRAAFVTVDRDQQVPQPFWSAVLDAIRSSGRQLGREGQRAATSAVDGDQPVDRVLSELAQRVDSVVLIVDDLHELRSDDAHKQLEHLVAVLPSSARVVFASRRDPPIRLHRLRLADEVAEIRAGDLRFTERETRELLASSGISLSDAAASALHRRTEGWAAGLRLAVISLAAHRDRERFVTEFSGTDLAIGEYLMAEMLERQPSEVQSMLLRTSLVDRVNGELADLLSGRPGSEQILLELEDANAFVVSLDAQRSWFRYHQLLRDFLRLELRRTMADEVRDLHRVAGQWFADQGYVVEAVRHRLGAGDWPDATRLLADHSFSLTLDGQEGTIGALLRSFPEGATADHPELTLARAATQLAQGRLGDAAVQLALAESHVKVSAPDRRRRLKVEIASLRLALARSSGHFTEVIEQVNLLDAAIADESNGPIALGSELRGVALMNLGIVEMWSGRFADAEQHLSEGAALAQAIGRPHLEVVCRAHLCFPSQLTAAATVRVRGVMAVALAERHGFDDRPILAPALGCLGGIAISTCEFDEGERWLCRAWAAAGPRVDPAAAVLLHGVTGMLHAARGEHQSALEAFAAAARAQSLLTDVHILTPRIAGWLAATQARLGMLDEARATVAELSAAPGQIGLIHDRHMGAIHNARAVICLAEGNPAAALDSLRGVLDVRPPVVPAFDVR